MGALMRNATQFLLMLGSLAALAGCGSVATGPAVKREATVAFTPEQREAMRAIDERDYLLRRGDVLAVRDLFNEVLNQDNVLVLPDGSATFFGLEQVRVVGLNLGQLNEMLNLEYAKEFRDPKVTVAVRVLGASDVYVLGEVRNPGAYPIPEHGFTAMAAVAKAGGFVTGADKGSVVLVRVTEQGYMCRELDLSGFAGGKTFDPAVVDIRPYDVIYISRTAIGNFAAFTSGLITSMLQYTQLAVDVKYITEGNVYRR
jgi:protein involved in polysaccharide export with SLBB domain